MLSDGIKRSLYFIGFSTIVQCVAIGAMVLSWSLCSRFGVEISPLALLLAGAVAGYGLASWLSFSMPWRVFNALIVPATLGMTSAGFVGDILVVTAAIFCLTYLPTIWTGIPYYPSNRKAYQAVMKLLPKERAFRFIDLGSGFAGILKFLSRKFPNGNFEGYEISPLPILLSKVGLALRPNVEIHASNFWNVNLAEYDYVYAFLAPGPMPKLWEKVKSEMRPGSTFITNTFQIDAKPTEIVNLSPDGSRSLYIFTIG